VLSVFLDELCSFANSEDATGFGGYIRAIRGWRLRGGARAEAGEGAAS
jgi:hypothetical protein